VREAFAGCFRESEPLRGRGLVHVPFIVVCIALLSLFRQVGTRPWRSLWAEDGAEFLLRALDRGSASFTDSYAGYGHLLPRTMAMLASALPLAWAPWVFSVGAAIFIGLIAAFVFVASRAYFRNTVVSYLAAIAAGLSPVAQIETMNTVTNLQWYLMIAVFWGLLWCPRSRTSWIASALVGLIGFGSAPLVVLLLPLLLLRLVAKGRKAVDPFLAGSALGLAYQLSIALTAPQRPGGTLHPRALAEGWGVRGILEFVGTHFTTSWARDLGWASVLIIFVSVLLAAVGGLLAAKNDPSGRTDVLTVALLIVICVAFNGFFFAVSFTRGFVSLPEGLYDWHSLNLIAGSRYSVLPLYLVTVIVLLCVDHVLSSRNLFTYRAILVAPAVALLGMALVTDYRGGMLRAGSPQWPAEVARAQDDCRHGAETAHLKIAPDNFVVSLSCAEVMRSR